MNDRQLLVQIAARDESAFRELYDRYRRLFFGWAFSKLNDEDSACDITQEFWLEVWKNAAKIPCNSAGYAKDYLLRQLSFRIIDHLRGQCKRLEITDILLQGQQMESFSYTHVQEELDLQELQQIIDSILRDLPPLIQKVYELRFVRKLSTKETAKILGIAESSVYNNLSAAIASLRKELVARYEVEPEKVNTFLVLLLWMIKI